MAAILPYFSAPALSPYLAAAQPLPYIAPEPKLAVVQQDPIDNPFTMYYLKQSGLFPTGITTQWNMQAAGAFGGDVPKSAIFAQSLYNQFADPSNPVQFNAAQVNPVSYLTAFGGVASDFYAGVDPLFLGLLGNEHGAFGSNDADFLTALFKAHNGPSGLQNNIYTNYALFNSGSNWAPTGFADTYAYTSGVFGNQFTAGLFA